MAMSVVLSSAVSCGAWAVSVRRCIWFNVWPVGSMARTNTQASSHSLTKGVQDGDECGGHVRPVDDTGQTEPVPGCGRCQEVSVRNGLAMGHDVSRTHKRTGPESVAGDEEEGQLQEDFHGDDGLEPAGRGGHQEVAELAGVPLYVFLGVAGMRRCV